jgi:hypothetical protein
MNSSSGGWIGEFRGCTDAGNVDYLYAYCARIASVLFTLRHYHESRRVAQSNTTVKSCSLAFTSSVSIAIGPLSPGQVTGLR